MRFVRSSNDLGVMLSLFALLIIASTIGITATLAQEKTSPVGIRITPPSPVVNEAARLAELSARRSRVAQRVGPDGILILFSAEPRVYTNDVDYEYRQENNLYYLTNLKQKGAMLVLMPGNSQTPEVLFLPKRDPAAETWTGHMYSPQEANAISGVSEIWEASEFEAFITALRTKQPFRPLGTALLMSGNGNASASISSSMGTQATVTTGTTSRQSPIMITAVNTGSNVSVTSSQTASSSPAISGNVSNSANSSSTGYERLFAASLKGDAQMYLLLPRDQESREYRREQTFAAQWVRTSTGFGVRDAWPIFVELRLKKSPMELRFLQHSIDITGEALGRAMATVGQLEWEYEVEAEVEYTFKRRNADFWGYPSIVGCGPNATTLHYNESQSRLQQGALLLMDVGAEYQHFSADVTRTFPVSGKFSPEQAEIYNIVYDAQEAAARATRPGVTLTDVHNAATEVVKSGLLKLGLITDRESNQFRIWFMHGTSHFLGMNVHDVGTRTTKLDPGMTFTNEPGIYIREDALDYLPKTPENERFIAAVRPAFEKYKNIGVRIEDDMLVTANGVEWMTIAIPRSIPDIESFMARASREFKLSILDSPVNWKQAGRP